MLEANKKQVPLKTLIQKYELIMSIKYQETKRKSYKTVTEIYWPEWQTSKNDVYIYEYQ